MAEIINFSETARSTDNALMELQTLFADELVGVEREIAKHMQSAAALDRKSTRLNSSHSQQTRMPSSA